MNKIEKIVIPVLCICLVITSVSTLFFYNQNMELKTKVQILQTLQFLTRNLPDQYNGLQITYNTLERELQGLNETFKVLLTNYTKLQSSYESLHVKYSALQRELQRLNERLNSLSANYTESQRSEESTPEDLQQLVETIKNELAMWPTDEELKELVIGLGITREDLDQLIRELTREEFDELLWGMKWAQQPAPEYTTHRVEDPEKYDVQGLRVNADFKIDLYSWCQTIEPGTYWVPAAVLGAPDDTIEELLQLKGQPEKAKEEINNLFEALAFMHLCLRATGGNIKTEENGIRWEFPEPAELAIKDGTVNCAGAVNVIWYLLEDDYDEVGCVWRHSPLRNESFTPERFGGHITSYIKENGKYYFFDPVSLAEKRSHYPVEDGDGHAYHCDSCDRIIQSTQRNYVIFWSQVSNYDEAIFAMWPGPGFALGSKGITFYYPKAFYDSNLTIWTDPTETAELVEASFSPTPPEKYLAYDPYKDYSWANEAEKGEPHVETIPSDG